jgi:hypothetical protein
METRIRPKDDYLHQAGFEHLHALTGHWKSDLEFHEQELRFLIKWIKDYKIWLGQDEDAAEMESLNRKLSEMFHEAVNLRERVQRHLGHLEELMENAFAHDERLFRDEHVLLEDDFTAFMKSYRDLKRILFESAHEVGDRESLPLTKA